MAVAQASKSGKKATTASKKSSKAAPSHPPYIDMITEALVSLKERTGSSHYAIAKHIEEQQKVKDLPSNFKKLLFNQLKKFVASGKLVKVKNSFKLPPSSKKSTDKPKPKPKPTPSTKETKKPVKKETVKAVKKAKASVTVTKKVTKSPAKKVAPAKAKKPKSIKSPAKKPSAKTTKK